MSKRITQQILTEISEKLDSKETLTKADITEIIQSVATDSVADNEQVRDWTYDILQQDFQDKVDSKIDLTKYGFFFKRNNELVTRRNNSDIIDEIYTDGVHLEQLTDNAYYLGIQIGGRWRRFSIIIEDGCVVAKTR